MGYTTEFKGSFKLNKPLTEAQADYINKFSSTRRMKRDAKKLESLPDPTREAVGLPIGTEGEFFTGGSGDFGQDRDVSILDYNDPPSTQPGLWCKWVVTKNREEIEWDGNEKFYHYLDWLEYIVSNFLIPWGCVLNGKVRWRGEDFDDSGTIIVTDNVVKHLRVE